MAETKYEKCHALLLTFGPLTRLQVSLAMDVSCCAAKRALSLLNKKQRAYFKKPFWYGCEPPKPLPPHSPEPPRVATPIKKVERIDIPDPEHDAWLASVREQKARKQAIAAAHRRFA